MNSTTIQEWLKAKKTRESGLNLLFAVLSLIAGLVALFCIFWFTYAIVYFSGWGISAASDLIFGKRFLISHEWRLIVSGVFLVLLFIQHLRTSPFYWGVYPERYSVPAPGLQALGVIGGALLANPRASANMITDILMAGPRLTTAAWTFWKQSWQLARLDVTGCARLLEFLGHRNTATPYEELREAGWETWFAQLRCIEGVVFLEKGLTLSEELRAELINPQMN